MRTIEPEAHAGLSQGDLLDFDALLFDFDGVLADSEPLYLSSWNEALSKWELSIGEEEYFLHWTSLGEGLNAYIQRHGLDRIDVPEARARQKLIYRCYCETGRIGLMPGAREILGLLGAGRFAGHHAIASNTEKDLIGIILSCAGASCPPVIGGRDLPHKPMPDIFLKASEALGTVPGRTLVFEDAWKGLEAARRGGFSTVLVRSAINREMVLAADFEIDGIISLLPLLRER